MAKYVSKSKRRSHSIRIEEQLLAEIQAEVRRYAGAPHYLTMSLVIERALIAWLEQWRTVDVPQYEQALLAELKKKHEPS